MKFKTVMFFKSFLVARHHALVFLTTFFGFVQSGKNTSNGSLPETRNCSLVSTSPVKMPAYIGWPFTLGCDVLRPALEELLLKEVEFYDQYNYGEVQVECQIWDSEQRIQVFNETFDSFYSGFPSYTSSDLRSNLTLNYVIILKVASMEACMSTMLSIQPIIFPNLTCAEALNTSTPVERRIQLSRSAVLHCEVPYSSSPKLNFRHLPMEHRWLRNCEEMPEEEVDTHSSFMNSLNINNISYNHPGIYTCAVFHNNQVWYTNHNRLCVEPPELRHKPYITCSTNRLFARAGQKVVLQCKGSVGSGRNLFGFTMKWKKANKTQCYNLDSFHDYEIRKEIPGLQCSYSTIPNPCFTRTPTSEEILEANSRAISMALTIDNAKESDSGEYEVVLINPFNRHEVTEKITLQVSSALSIQQAAFAIGVPTFIFLLTLSGIVAYFLHKREKKCALKRKESIDDTTTITEVM